MPTNNMQVQTIRAIRLTVTDINRSKNFYTQALGFEVVSDITVDEQNSSDIGVELEAIRLTTLQLGTEVIELIQYLNVEGKPIPKDSQSNDLWFQHLAIVVSDMDSAYAHLQSFFVEYISTEPQTIPLSNTASAGVRAFKFKDPDGHNLELIWFPADKGQQKWHELRTNRLFLGIDHSAITVADTEQSLEFYRDYFGMQVKEGSLNSGETQAHLDGLSSAKVKVTPLRPSKGVGIEMLDYIVPANGRPIPSDWKSSDIATVQIELVVNDIEEVVERLRQHGVECISLRVVFTNSASLYQQGFLVKDPNGHQILLIAE